MTLLDLAENLREGFYDVALEWRDNLGEEETLSIKFLLMIYESLNILYNVVWLLTRRLPCLIFGCKIKHLIPFNIPEGFYDEECTRCGAYSEMNGYYKTDYEIIYDNILTRLNGKLRG